MVVVSQVVWHFLLQKLLEFLFPVGGRDKSVIYLKTQINYFFQDLKPFYGFGKKAQILAAEVNLNFD